jgi:hypothetical protein
MYLNGRIAILHFRRKGCDAIVSMNVMMQIPPPSE